MPAHPPADSGETSARAGSLRRLLLRTYWICWTVALIIYAIRPELVTRRDPAEDALTGGAFFVIVLGLIALSVRSRRELVWLLLAGVIGTAMEVIGLATGWPFGSYVTPIRSSRRSRASRRRSA